MMLKRVDCQIYQYDDSIMFHPILPEVADTLTITEKSLELNKKTWLRGVVYRKRELFSRVKRDCGEVGVTYPGFLNRIVMACMASHKTFNVQDQRKAIIERGFPKPDLDAIYGLRFSQPRLVKELVSANKSGLLGAPTRYGKCMSIDTKVLTADYNIIKIQDVKVGDELMGPDGLPRKVIALGRGREQSYRIIPNKGESFSCNASHILPLKITGEARMDGCKKGDIVCIQLKDYLNKSKTFKHISKLWYAPIEFSETTLPVDPWLVGIWVGYGYFSGGSRLTNPDKGVQQGLIDWANKNGSDYRSAFRQIADMCCINDEKRIPKQYLTSSRKQRLELLAGLIDTDGYSNSDMCYEIVTKYDGLSEDIIRLCRGLGFIVTRNKKIATIKYLNFSGECWIIQISGDVAQIPCRSHKKITVSTKCVDHTTTGFTVEAIGEQDYYGVVLEGPDKLFLLWDHLVTHNTSMMINTMRAFPTLPTVVVAPGVDLCNQLYDDLMGPRGISNREIKLICSGSKTRYPSEEGITVCSADSLDKCDFGQTQLLISDEPHAMVTDSRLNLINSFTCARRYGFGATLNGRFDGRDKLIEGLFGPVLTEVTYKEAVEEGAICPLVIIFVRVPVTPGSYRSRDEAYKEKLFLNKDMAQLTARICKEVIPDSYQTMIFIKNEAQAELYLSTIGDDATIAMAKRMSKQERADITELMRADKIKRCLCTDIYVQGVTFSDARVLINCEAGGNNTTAIQKPGRLAEIRPNKKCGVIFDFYFEPPDGIASNWKGEQWMTLCSDSKSRLKAYEEKGYDIKFVSTVKEAKAVFDEVI